MVCYTVNAECLLCYSLCRPCEHSSIIPDIHGRDHTASTVKSSGYNSMSSLAHMFLSKSCRTLHGLALMIFWRHILGGLEKVLPDRTALFAAMQTYDAVISGEFLLQLLTHPDQTDCTNIDIFVPRYHFTSFTNHLFTTLNARSISYHPMHDDSRLIRGTEHILLRHQLLTIFQSDLASALAPIVMQPCTLLMNYLAHDHVCIGYSRLTHLGTGVLHCHWVTDRDQTRLSTLHELGFTVRHSALYIHGDPAVTSCNDNSVCPHRIRRFRDSACEVVPITNMVPQCRPWTESLVQVIRSVGELEDMPTMSLRFDEIYLVLETLTFLGDRRALHLCGLVCKEWSHTCRSLLYRCITFTVSPTSHLQNLFAHLSTYPSITQCIQDLKITSRATPFARDSHTSFTTASLNAILQLLPNLRCLTIRNCSITCTNHSFLEIPYDVLRLSRVHLSTVSTFCHKQSSFTLVFIDRVTTSSDNSNSSRPVAIHTHTLTITLPNTRHKDSSPPMQYSLRYGDQVTVSNIRDTDHVALRSLLSLSTSTLTIVCLEWSPPLAFRNPSPWTCPELTACDALKSITLSYPVGYNVQFWQDAIYNVIRQLPQSVTQLTLQYDFLGWVMGPRYLTKTLNSNWVDFASRIQSLVPYVSDVHLRVKARERPKKDGLAWANKLLPSFKRSFHTIFVTAHFTT
ncbi:uncharacterized protein PHACADRAFT_187148 [Phanerochaete carnosa HHB-10118-sp]|uniref:Uncharacterized protein n=1 Tax=Phanerochaete carnosa (strain HHB-10118-sp) TaxID=650164 RepID=K5UPL2_PHACS|nr:uncharacterized protein PHACADRAFT_187148 [Phanerochaete carnosa HHB-10118-sp]EKM51731.1 hypothetical protein PHACADRAFT_187148 [Phanerochaete carnosa HHB-10118-sp]